MSLTSSQAAGHGQRTWECTHSGHVHSRSTLVVDGSASSVPDAIISAPAGAAAHLEERALDEARLQCVAQSVDEAARPNAAAHNAEPRRHRRSRLVSESFPGTTAVY